MARPVKLPSAAKTKRSPQTADARLAIDSPSSPKTGRAASHQSAWTANSSQKMVAANNALHTQELPLTRCRVSLSHAQMRVTQSMLMANAMILMKLWNPDMMT
jgi:hypothetical protein